MVAMMFKLSYNTNINDDYDHEGDDDDDSSNRQKSVELQFFKFFDTVRI